MECDAVEHAQLFTVIAEASTEEQLVTILVGEHDHAAVEVEPFLEDLNDVGENLVDFRRGTDRLADFVVHQGVAVVDVHLFDQLFT